MKTFTASLAAVWFAVAATSVRAEPLASGGLGPKLCAPDQLSGHYECVTSTPLTDAEVRVSMAYLAALKPRQAGVERASIAVADAAAQQRLLHD